MEKNKVSYVGRLIVNHRGNLSYGTENPFGVFSYEEYSRDVDLLRNKYKNVSRKSIRNFSLEKIFVGMSDLEEPPDLFRRIIH